MIEKRADRHLNSLVCKYPELAWDINFLNIRKTPKEENSKNLTGISLKDFKISARETFEEKKKVLFAHFSPFKYELEGIGLPYYASKALPNSEIHVTYDKGKSESIKFKIKDSKWERIDNLSEYYDIIIARSSVLLNMMNRKDDAEIVKKSRHKVNIKTMSYRPNYVYADVYFSESELCPVAPPQIEERSKNAFLKFKKKNIILITGSLWHVKTQLSFFQQVDPHILKEFDVVVVGPEKDSLYVSQIEAVCKKRGIDPFIIGNVCENFLVNLYCISKIHVITMDMRVFGQPEGYPRVLGEGMAGKCLTVCNMPVTIPEFFKDSCLVYNYEQVGDLNRVLKKAIDVVSCKHFPDTWKWPNFSFEDQCSEILKKCIVD